jgi:hypothetical protein
MAGARLLEESIDSSLTNFTTAIASAAALIADIEYAHSDGKELPGQALEDRTSPWREERRLGRPFSFWDDLDVVFTGFGHVLAHMDQPTASIERTI